MASWDGAFANNPVAALAYPTCRLQQQAWTPQQVAEAIHREDE
jgi:hypothetical protein